MKNKVLIIEDSNSFADALKCQIVEEHGFAVDVAKDLHQARELLACTPIPYFCAVVDLNLPDAPNGEAVDDVVNKHIPTLVFTGTLNQAAEKDLWPKGISDYAHKSGAHNLDYIVWKIHRLYANAHVEVLVVDDSITACKSMGNLLRTQRLLVHLCTSGEEALAILKENSNIRIMITDWNMSNMNGLVLTSKLRETYSSDELEIIGVSASGGQGMSAQFIKCGANDFLHKPFAPEEFLCRINRSIERIETYLKLKELNKLKNQLLGTAAHDIRGPIGAIKTAADYLALRAPNADRVTSLAEMIRESSSDLLDLLDNILDISSLQSGHIQLKQELLSLDELVQDRIALYQPSAEEKGIHIQYTATTAAKFYADKIKIKQVIDNLITNAIKYSPKKSNINLEISETKHEVYFKIIDSGPGISEQQQDLLFKPFTVLNTKATGGEKSTGLGLAIAKTIVNAHKGEITYQTSPTGGACFTLELPKKIEV